MKRITTIITSFALVFILSACSKYQAPLQIDELAKMLENRESFTMVVSATTCGPCNDIKLELQEVKNDHKDFDIYFFEINRIRMYQDRMQFLNSFQYTELPTTYFFKNGEIQYYKGGIIKSDDFTKMYEKYILGK